MLLQTILKQPAAKVDTVTIVKADTVRLPSDASFELMSKIDSFYNNSWTSLLWVVGILLGIVGIIIPLVISHYQRKQFRLEKDELITYINSVTDKTSKKIKKRIKVSNNILKTELKNHNEEILNEAIKELKYETNYKVNELQAIQSYVLRINDKASLSILKALSNLLLMESIDGDNLKQTIENVKVFLGETKSLLRVKDECKAVMNKIAELNTHIEFSADIDIILKLAEEKLDVQ